MATYSLVRYAADGHAGEDGDGAVVASGLSLRQAQERVRALAGGDWGTWVTEDGHTAYHASQRERCGGWVLEPEEVE